MPFKSDIAGIRHIARMTAIVVGTLVVSGCAQPTLLDAPQLAVGGPDAAYRLDVGDKIRLGVFNEPTISGEFEVGGSGQVAVPLIGKVEGRGKTLDEFRRHVASRLADGYLQNPKVNVEVVNYRPVFVHGEVKKGGEYQFRNGLRLSDAVAMAGGYTYRAEQGYVRLSRNGAPVSDISANSNFELLPGDNIRIPERYF